MFEIPNRLQKRPPRQRVVRNAFALVIGETLVQDDAYYESRGERSVKLRDQETKLGGWLVVEMLWTLGIQTCYVGGHEDWPPVRRYRYHVDGKLVLSEDIAIQQPPYQLDPDAPPPPYCFTWHERREQARLRRRPTIPTIYWRPPRRRDECVVVIDQGHGVVSREIWEQVLQRHPSSRIIVDPAPARPASFYDGAWCVLPNTSEEQQAQYTERFHRVVVKHGPLGVVARERDQIVSLSAYPVEVVDTLGAGEQFAATLLTMLLCGHPFFDAAERANVAAGIQCGREGVAPVTWREIAHAMGEDMKPLLKGK